MTPVLHFEDRPYTSPCALCPADIPLDQTVSLADEQRNTVCDDCAQQIDPRQYAALKVLRQVDDGWSAIAGGAPYEPQALADAAAFVRHVAAGAAVLAEFYGGTADPNERSVGYSTSSI